MASNKKRKQPIPRIEDKEVLGPFPITIDMHVPYFVCDENRQKITVNLVKWLMGNNVNFDPGEIQKAIDFLFERDHEAFLLLLSGKIEVGDFGPVFVPMVFFSQMPDVLNPEEFGARRIQAMQKSSGNFKQRFSHQFSKMARISGWINTNDIPVPRDYIKAGTLQGDVAERKVFYVLQEYFEKTKDACPSQSFLSLQSEFQRKGLYHSEFDQRLCYGD